MNRFGLSAIVGMTAGSLLVEYLPGFFNGHVLVVAIALITAGAASLPLKR